MKSKTVLGPTNVFLYDGANALQAGHGEEGVRLTLKGLKLAHGQREEKMGHANLCAGFVLMRQAQSALEHCNWVLERDPFHWRTYNNRAIAYLQLERFEESEADVKRGQELNPRSENLKEVKGMLLDEIAPVTENITIDDRRSPPDTADEEPQ
ncbi:MAG: tetratricopeptide repeat protein [Gammaproteobacteria bacterium]|nr:tetratricopeptide repeat protein [Gammaproteobacteria bacterium]